MELADCVWIVVAGWGAAVLSHHVDVSGFVDALLSSSLRRGECGVDHVNNGTSLALTE